MPVPNYSNTIAYRKNADAGLTFHHAYRHLVTERSISPGISLGYQAKKRTLACLKSNPAITN
jgi:hypothetical protein